MISSAKLSHFQGVGDLCPGESPRWGDYELRCIHVSSVNERDVRPLEKMWGAGGPSQHGSNTNVVILKDGGEHIVIGQGADDGDVVTSK